MSTQRLAPAKVNLYLHVAAPDARGYHPLQSLVVFADIGDEVRLLARKPGEGAGLSVQGPFGDNLCTGEDNLILRAVRRFEQVAGITIDRHDIELTKNLPIASGIGGGSADAGAILHLLREAYAPNISDTELSMIAGATGSDGVMCLWAKAGYAEGYGEELTFATLPQLPAVLINPLVECSTADVYKGFDAKGHIGEIDAREPFDDITDIAGLVKALKATRNDLQAPATAIQPIISQVLSSLAGQPETLLSRMSGSGATCFALCATDRDAVILAARLKSLWPDAWAKACRLG